MPGDIKFVGDQRELFAKHLFLIEITPGDMAASFQKCSELSYESAKIEYWEGGSIIPYKMPGRVTMADVTLDRGVTRNSRFFSWAAEVSNAAAGFPDNRSGSNLRGNGLITPQYMRQMDVVQLDRDARTELAVWRVYNAWPTKFVAGDWDATADEAVIEQLTLTFDYFELISVAV